MVAKVSVRKGRNVAARRPNVNGGRERVSVDGWSMG